MAQTIRSPLAPDQANFKVPKLERSARPRSRLKRAGKKVLDWERIRAILNKRFLAASITSCEVRRPGCWQSEALSHAHIDKRRYLTPEELWVTCLACIPVCHKYLESLPRAEMKNAVLEIIAKRAVAITLPTA